MRSSSPRPRSAAHGGTAARSLVALAVLVLFAGAGCGDERAAATRTGATAPPELALPSAVLPTRTAGPGDFTIGFRFAHGWKQLSLKRRGLADRLHKAHADTPEITQEAHRLSPDSDVLYADLRPATASAHGYLTHWTAQSGPWTKTQTERKAAQRRAQLHALRLRTLATAVSGYTATVYAYAYSAPGKVDVFGGQIVLGQFGDSGYLFTFATDQPDRWRHELVRFLAKLKIAAA